LERRRSKVEKSKKLERNERQSQERRREGKVEELQVWSLKSKKGKSDTGSCIARLAYCGSRISDIRHGPSSRPVLGKQGIKWPGRKVVVIKRKEAKRRNS
jgi:hypothetical protein